MTTIETAVNPLKDYLRTSGSPWWRWAARILDVFLFDTVVIILVGLSGFDLTRLSGAPEMVLQAVVMLLWIPVEAWFISAVAATPGKWLFGLSLRHVNGSHMVNADALSRAGLVFARGLGCGVFGMIALPVQFWQFANFATTSWDRDYETTIRRRRHDFRAAIGIACILGYMYALAYLSRVEGQ